MKYDTGKRRPNLFRHATHRRPILPLSLLILASLVFLFSLVTPSRFFTTINPASVKVPAFTPTPTALPRPTDVHGGHIVFTCTRKEINQICLINADGTGSQQLTNESTNAYYPAISPDGEHIVFALNKYDGFDLYALVRGNSSLTQLTAYVGNAFSPSFAPDGHQLVFVNRDADGKSSLWTVGMQGENVHVLYDAPNTIVAAAWSPDGASIAFAMAVNSQFAYEVFLLSMGDLKAVPRQISNGLGNIGGSLAWSRDGKDLLIFAGPVAAREVYRLDVTTGATARLTFGGNNAAAAYSPDGQYIVFNSLRNNGQADLYIMRADGHSTRQLTNNPEPDWQPEWGP